MTAVILLGFGSMSGLIRATLTDWSAAGLLEPFIWVDRSALGGPTTQALRIADGLAGGCHVETELASSGRLVRVGVLSATVDAPGDAEQTEALDLLRLCHRVRADAQVVPIRCLVSYQVPAEPVSVSLVGWHNLLISAEDSFDPRQGIVPSPTQPDPATIGPNAAGVVASLFGLWKGMTAACLDDVQVPPGQPVQLVRANVRIGEATELAANLRNRTFDLQQVPAVRTPSGMSEYIEDTRSATVGTADALWVHHRGKFYGGRLTLPPQEPEKRGVGEALRLFFSFLGAALRSAPRAWALGVANAATGRVADWVQGMVYGQDSAFQVVARGELGRLSGDELVGAMQTLDRELDRYEHRPQEAYADFGTLWQGYADGALTLIDAGERSSVTPPVMIGTKRGTVRSVSQVVPSAAESFRPDANVADATGVTQVRGEDWLGQYHFVARLARLRSQLGDEAIRRTHGQLQAWQRTHEHSYASRLGALLGGRMEEITQEINAISAQLAAAANTDLDSEIDAAQRRTAGRMRAIAIVAVSLLVVFGVLYGFDTITLTWLIGLILADLLGWLVASVLVYLRGQQLFFQWLNRRRRAMTAVTVNQNNLRSAVRDGRQVSEAYQQFLCWTRVLAGFLHRPYGTGDRGPAGQLPQLEGLPLGVALARVTASPNDQAVVAGLLRRGHYQAGWLSELWQHELAAAPGLLGPDAYDLVSQPALIFSQRTGSPGSLLARWAGAIETNGPSGAGAAQAWQRAVAGLQHTGESLFSRAVIAMPGRTVSAGEFFDALLDPAPGQPFDSRFLTSQAVLGRAHFPALPAWTQTFDSAWGRGVVRVEFSQPLHLEAFAFPQARVPEQSGIQDVI